MSLKENWTKQDILKFSDFNKIIEEINETNNKLSINSLFEKKIKKNIKIGDDLSDKTIYFEFADDICDEIINDVAGGQDNIITTNKHSIIEYGNTNNNIATISIDNWMDTIYYANYSDFKVYKNLSEKKLSSDFGVVTSINENLTAYKYIFVQETEIFKKQNGDFLTLEDLQKIENSLNKISKATGISFKKRNWYYLSVIDFSDLNRWAKFINIVNQAISKASEDIDSENNEKIMTENSVNIITEGEIL